MKRVTYWNDEYGCWSYHCSSGDAANLLAAYENTGLEPEKVLTAKENAEVACALNLLKEYQSIGSVEHFRELSRAEKDGRLMVLPCKVTDTVYLIESVLKGKKVTGEQVVSALIDHVTIGGTVGKPVFDICSATDNWYMALDPGEFFLTHEEAEAALAEKGIES